MKRVIKLMLMAFTMVLLAGCEKKAITVADMISDEEGQQYIEMKEFQLKNKEEEKNKETGSAECMVRIPAGYVEAEGMSGMYVHEKYPLDSSNIYYAESEYEDADYRSLTKEGYKEIIEEAYTAAYGTQMGLKVKSFEKQEMEGFPAYLIESSYEVGENTIEQLVYLIAADKLYTITFSQASDDVLFADYEITQGRITLIRK